MKLFSQRRYLNTIVDRSTEGDCIAKQTMTFARYGWQNFLFVFGIRDEKLSRHFVAQSGEKWERFVSVGSRFIPDINRSLFIGYFFSSFFFSNFTRSSSGDIFFLSFFFELVVSSAKGNRLDARRGRSVMPFTWPKYWNGRAKERQRRFAGFSPPDSGWGDRLGEDRVGRGKRSIRNGARLIEVASGLILVDLSHVNALLIG